MDLAVDSRIKTLDVGIPVFFFVEFEVCIVEHSSFLSNIMVT